MKEKNKAIKRERRNPKERAIEKDRGNPKERANCNSPQLNRRSIRLKNYDYSSKGQYFITLCTANRKNIFGEIQQGEIHLNTFGRIADEEWKKTPEIRKNISLGEYIIMPNHFHCILRIDYKLSDKGRENIGKFYSPSQTIGAIIRGFKGATTKRINNLIREMKENPEGELDEGELDTGELQFAPTRAKNFALTGKGSIWQRDYYEHIIKTERAFYNISNYIINNPKKWEQDKMK